MTTERLRDYHCVTARCGLKLGATVHSCLPAGGVHAVISGPCAPPLTATASTAIPCELENNCGAQKVPEKSKNQSQVYAHQFSRWTA